MVKKALLMVDLQNDFCQGGKLAVPEGDAVVPIANKLQPYFDLVVASQDWHPVDHMSFASNHPGYQIGDSILVDSLTQILWPEHCVQESTGARLHPQLQTARISKLVHKGVETNIDSYSAFFDNLRLRSTGLGAYLRDQDVLEVYLLGLATDYCVKYSALDAAELGFQVYVIKDACRGIEIHPGDIAATFQEMQAAGITLIESQDILSATQ